MKRYPCVGGPLDGHHAAREDFRKASTHPRFPYDGGVYRDQHDNYIAFNRADTRRGVPTMIWLYRGLLV